MINMLSSLMEKSKQHCKNRQAIWAEMEKSKNKSRKNYKSKTLTKLRMTLIGSWVD